MSDQLNDYLSYLDEQGIAKGISTALTKGLDVVGSGIRTGGFWSLIIIPSVFTAWRTANFAFSDAVRKCGAFKKGAGRDACIARERIKALQQRLNILSSAKPRCDNAKDQKMCLQKLEIEVNKTKNRIQREKDRLSSALGESVQVNEQMGMIATTAGVLIGGLIFDKASFLAMRTAQGLFNSASRKCGTYAEGPEREICMSKYKLASLMQQKAILTKVAAKQKNPEKVSKKMESINRKIQIEKDTITASKNELNLKRREEEFKRAQKEQTKPK